MNITKKIDSKCKEIWENRMSEAELKGYGFIEIRHGSRDFTNETFMGVDQAKVVKMNSGTRGGFDLYSVKIISDGILEFVADSSGVRWGYLLDSEKNRAWLASMVASGRMITSDAEVTKVAKVLKSEMGEVKDRNLSNYLDKRRVRKEATGISETERLQKQIDEMKDNETARLQKELEDRNTGLLDTIKEMQEQIKALAKPPTRNRGK